MKKNKLLILVGPTGSGKTELCRKLCELGGFERLVTATTRPPREGEKDGVDYHFLSEKDFDVKVSGGEFAEWAYVHKTYRYGTLTQPLLHQLERADVVVVSVDIQGYRSLVSCSNPLIPQAIIGVFILTSDFSMLERRIRARSNISEEEVQRRLETARKELLAIRDFDWIVVNDDGKFDEAFCQLIGIVTMA